MLSSQTVVDIVAGVSNFNPVEIADLIIEQASYMWKVEEGDYRDDITVIVMLLPWCTPEMTAGVANAKAEDEVQS